MTDEELAKKIVDNLNHDEILANINERGYFMPDYEKKEVITKGGLL